MKKQTKKQKTTTSIKHTSIFGSSSSIVNYVLPLSLYLPGFWTVSFPMHAPSGSPRHRSWWDPDQIYICMHQRNFNGSIILSFKTTLTVAPLREMARATEQHVESAPLEPWRKITNEISWDDSHRIILCTHNSEKS